jgi:uncharacterized protein (TIGR02099 family)
MKNIFRRLMKVLAYTAATAVILLAIAVEVFRLYLPQVPQYQDEFKTRVSAAIGLQVEFSDMDARWGLSGPELEFYNAELFRPDSGNRIIAAEEVRVGVRLLRLLLEQEFVIDRLVILKSSIDVSHQKDGDFQIQGSSLDELLGSEFNNKATPTNIEIIGEDIELNFTQSSDDHSYFFNVQNVRVSIDNKRIAVDANVRLPNNLGHQLNVSASQLYLGSKNKREWNIILDADDVSLAGWSSLMDGDPQFQSGSGDMELALVVSNEGISTLTAELDFVDVAIEVNELFDISGRFEADMSNFDWLIAINGFRLSTVDYEWPESSLRVEAGFDDVGNIMMLNVRASHLNLDDLGIMRPLLNEELKDSLLDLQPSGVIRNLAATVSELDGNEPQFNISAELDRVGIAAALSRPGVRDFSGLVRANHAGGLLEIESTEFEIDMPEYLSQAIEVSHADGTIIWRTSNNRTTIISDSITINNDIINSQSNVQLVLYKNGLSPEIDLASTWSISDIAELKRYIPEKVTKPILYKWLQMALVNGSISRGTTTLNGPLDKFPFDDGEGRLLIEASVRNMTFKYHKLWPAMEELDIEVILDNTQLYTTKNQSISAGIPVVNAQVNIPDLRDPVLNIEFFSMGRLESIRNFSIQSPISNMLGGQLDRVSVEGEASLDLDLMMPLKREHIQEYEFQAQVQSNNGMLAVAGFDPPIKDLTGKVIIERDRIESEGLSGKFLGQNISISMQHSKDPQFSMIATALGIATTNGIVNELGVPMEGLIKGAAAYQARVLFPNYKVKTKSPLTVQIESDLNGIEFLLPVPFGKAADSLLPISGDIRFMPNGENIESAGFAENHIAWQLAFNKSEESWDFDRGVITMGGDVMQTADTQGLHIRGSTSELILKDWISFSRNGEKRDSVVDLVRSVDLTINNFHYIGQHLRGHRFRVDRSAAEWLVQLDGEDVVGSIFVPYDFNSERKMVFDMKRLRLPGDKTQANLISKLDPRELPAMQLTAAEFAFGDRYFGAIEATLEKTEQGLVATKISTSDTSFKIDGTGRWFIDDEDTLGSHSFFDAILTSTDVEQTMARLNYAPEIDSKELSVDFDLNWSGSPHPGFLEILNGEVQIQLGTGQLKEVEPGAGRVFGLMSIIALPRRLALDFRDVFNKGFGFDKIAGTFQIVDGITYTCDLSLDGPAADIGIVGEANIANRTYEQTAIVSPNVGNTLPIVGAVVAGPQVMAALLVFSQIFKKPLQEVGQAYYAIDGSWDMPSIESTDSAAFVASGELAECLLVEELN